MPEPDSLDSAPVAESKPAPTIGQVVVTLKPSQMPLKIVGYLSLVSTPEANEIYLNNQLLVDENDKPIRTPLKDFPLPPGKYNLEMKSTFFEVSHKGTFTIEKNKINTVEVFLKK
jgi:hypothetical protein